MMKTSGDSQTSSVEKPRPSLHSSSFVLQNWVFSSSGHKMIRLQPRNTELLLNYEAEAHKTPLTSPRHQRVCAITITARFHTMSLINTMRLNRLHITGGKVATETRREKTI